MELALEAARLAAALDGQAVAAVHAQVVEGADDAVIPAHQEHLRVQHFELAHQVAAGLGQLFTPAREVEPAGAEHPLALDPRSTPRPRRPRTGTLPERSATGVRNSGPPMSDLRERLAADGMRLDESGGDEGVPEYVRLPEDLDRRRDRHEGVGEVQHALLGGGQGIQRKAVRCGVAIARMCGRMAS